MSLGFAAYFASNIALYYPPAIRHQYALRHENGTPAVAFNDIIFALHALTISSITASQYLLFNVWNFTPASGNRPSRLVYGIIVGSAVGLGATYIIIGSKASSTLDPATDWCDLDAVYALGYIKLLVTLVKFTPQLLRNFRNRSTQGWSIWQILLDLTGGVLSISQLAIDSYLQGSWHGFTGNPVKFMLANVSMVYDALFMLQHYVLYKHNTSREIPYTRLD